MRINKFITFKGERLPLVNTPITVTEENYLKGNYDRFIIYDVARGTYSFRNSGRITQRYKVDIGYRPIIFVALSMFCTWKLVKAKKNLKKSLKNFKGNGAKDFTETINGWSIKEEKVEMDEPQA